jgi:hypothetical protein
MAVRSQRYNSNLIEFAQKQWKSIDCGIILVQENVNLRGFGGR